MSWVPLLLSNTIGSAPSRDKVIKFSSWGEASTQIRRSLSSLFGILGDFDLDTGKFDYLDEEGKKQRRTLNCSYEEFKSGFYIGFTISDEDGFSNLLEIAIVEELLKEGK